MTKIDKITNSKINTGGGKFIGGDDNSEQNIQLIIQSDQPLAKDIYFFPGDSDFQSFVLAGATNGEVQNYYEEMETAFRLLLCFKPDWVYIVIAPSSLIQSAFTLYLFEKYSALRDLGIGKIVREKSWSDYIYKRQNTLGTLQSKNIYKRYFNQNITDFVGEFPTIKKTTYSGFSCSKSWTDQTNEILQINMIRCSINDELRNQILEDGIFVWDNIEPLLNSYKIPKRLYSDLHYGLISSYFKELSYSYDFPMNFFCANQNYNFSNRNVSYLNLNFLKQLIKKSGAIHTFRKLTIKQLRYLLQDNDFLAVKSLLLEAVSPENAIHILINSNYLQNLSKALRKAENW